jgi:hypothetical protein
MHRDLEGELALDSEGTRKGWDAQASIGDAICLRKYEAYGFLVVTRVSEKATGRGYHDCGVAGMTPRPRVLEY